jgi:hypothetical protein
MRASAFGWPRSVSRLGGNPPAPACPRRGKRERGRPNSLLPQATSGSFPDDWNLAPMVTHSALPSAVQSRLDAVAP